MIKAWDQNSARIYVYSRRKLTQCFCTDTQILQRNFDFDASSANLCTTSSFTRLASKQSPTPSFDSSGDHERQARERPGYAPEARVSALLRHEHAELERAQLVNIQEKGMDLMETMSRTKRRSCGRAGNSSSSKRLRFDQTSGAWYSRAFVVHGSARFSARRNKLIPMAVPGEFQRGRRDMEGRNSVGRMQMLRGQSIRSRA